MGTDHTNIQSLKQLKSSKFLTYYIRQSAKMKCWVKLASYGAFRIYTQIIYYKFTIISVCNRQMKLFFVLMMYNTLFAFAAEGAQSI